ncbi:Fc.00g032320.m01.CDS01 [Cosmosporella sp. VM-42]
MSTKRKAPAKLAAPTLKSSARIPNKATIDESRASIAGADTLQTSQIETIEISSDGDSDEDISDADDSEEEQKITVNGDNARLKAPKPNGQLLSPTKSPQEEDSDDASPSFGELLRADTEAIDVPSLLNDSTAVSQPTRAIVPPSHQSLTTVLSQALRTDDVDLLESCLHTTDLPTIRNTIERLDSSLASILLIKLAARLYRRPGRAGNLMTWVQWTLVAHGGALASQPKVIQSLNGLQKVLADRARGLNSLLALKGKLDMLEGQMDLRRKMQRGSAKHTSESDDEEDVIWVEGDDLAHKHPTPGSEDDMPMANGFIGSSSDEDASSAGEESDSEAAEESLDEDEVDHDDVDESMGEEEESDVEAAPPAKVLKTGTFGKRK